ncbi:hypothetical protein DFS33DRAFT_1454511 [Desarmillaria ectypa]|nr:hypothetical protein DFS33DRAFT_1454511 [Desarmillaria ectypa]
MDMFTILALPELYSPTLQPRIKGAVLLSGPYTFEDMPADMKDSPSGRTTVKMMRRGRDKCTNSVSPVWHRRERHSLFAPLRRGVEDEGRTVWRPPSAPYPDSRIRQPRVMDKLHPGICVLLWMNIKKHKEFAKLDSLLNLFLHEENGNAREDEVDTDIRVYLSVKSSVTKADTLDDVDKASFRRVRKGQYSPVVVVVNICNQLLKERSRESGMMHILCDLQMSVAGPGVLANVWKQPSNPREVSQYLIISWYRAKWMEALKRRSEEKKSNFGEKKRPSTHQITSYPKGSKPGHTSYLIYERIVICVSGNNGLNTAIEQMRSTIFFSSSTEFRMRSASVVSFNNKGGHSGLRLEAKIYEKYRAFNANMRYYSGIEEESLHEADEVPKIEARDRLDAYHGKIAHSPRSEEIKEIVHEAHA